MDEGVRQRSGFSGLGRGLHAHTPAAEGVQDTGGVAKKEHDELSASAGSSAEDRANIFADHVLLNVALRRVATPPAEREKGFLEEPLDAFDDIGQLSKSLPRFSFTDFLARFPSIVMIISVAFPILFMVLIVTHENVFKTGPSEFRGMYHPAIRSFVAFEAATLEWSTRQQTLEITPRERTLPKYRLFIQFQPKDGTGALWSPGRTNSYDMFGAESVSFIQHVESIVFATSVYLQLCWTNNLKFSVEQTKYPACVPPTSVSSLFFPGDLQMSPTGYVEFEMSGNGRILQVPQDSVVRTLLLNDRHRWFGDMGFTNVSRKSSVLRTQITLGFPLIFENSTELTLERYNVFVDRFILDLFARLEEISHPKFAVTFGGDRVIDAIIAGVLDSQLMLTIATLAVAFAMLWFHIGSFALAACGVGQMVLCYLASYYVFSVVTSKKELMLISAISMIVVMSSNSHTIMWVYESWVQSGLLHYRGRRNSLLTEERLAHMFSTAMPSILISRLVGACAFGSMFLSPVPAVKHFSVLMVLNVFFDLFLSCTFWPSILLLYFTHYSKSLQTLLKQQRATTVRVAKKAHFRDIAMSDFLRCEEATKRYYEEVTTQDLKQSVYAASSLFASRSRGFSTFDPMGRAMSMAGSGSERKSFRNHSFAGSQSVVEGDQEEDFGPYRSERMVPLPMIFQIIPQIAVPSSGRATVDGAMAAQLRRANITGKRFPDFTKPAYVKKGRVKLPAPMSAIRNHYEKWDYVGNFIGSVRPDDFSAYVTELTVGSVGGSSLVWDDARHMKTSYGWERGRPLSLKSSWHVNDLYRCLIRPSGGRSGSDREEVDSFKLNYRTWHSGVSRSQMMLQRHVLRGIVFARYVLVVLALIGAVALVSLAFFFKNMTMDPLLVNPGPVIADYDTINALFPIKGVCDYCSGFQTKLDKLPTPGLYDLQQCYSQGYGMQMAAVLDRCGVCFGGNACLDCATRPWGISVMDSCDLCVQGTNIDYCQRCGLGMNPSNPACTPCGKLGSPGKFGASCSVSCSDANCPKNRGFCNTYTGICECHFDRVNGFFQSDPGDKVQCSRCAPGFFDGVNGTCLYECSKGDPCGCRYGKCWDCSPSTVGAGCAFRNISACRFGTLSGPNGTCDCPSRYDAESCSVDESCSRHGRLYSSSEATPAGCGCVGQWVGPKCEYCRCYNGGWCHPTRGHCVCAGGWEGIDCSICAATCEVHGLCGRPIYTNQYTFETCMGVFCSEQDWASGTVCATCQNNFHNQGKCDPYVDMSTCNAYDMSVCEWDGSVGKCKAQYIDWPTEPINRCYGCIGYFTGPACEICSNPYGLQCDYDGVLIGCDGKRTTVGKHPRYMDRCGVCAGSGHCLGCDGIIGSSQVPDQCGVCSGHDECMYGDVPMAKVGFVWGLIGHYDATNGSFSSVSRDPLFDISNTTFQRYLYDTCSMLMRHMPHMIKMEHSHCAWKEFVDWVTTPDARRFYSNPANNYTVNMTEFPFVTNSSNEWNLHAMLYNFADIHNRFSDLGFTINKNDTESRLEWFRCHMSTTIRVNAGYTAMLEGYERFEKLRLYLFFHPSNIGNILHVSKEWTVAINQWSAIRVVKYACGTAIVVFVIGLAVMTLQPLLALFGTIAMGATMASSLFVYFLMDWELGPVEQMGVAVAVAFSSQHAIALCVEFDSRLRLAAPPFLSNLEIRIEALRGAFVSIAPPIIFSMVIAIVAVGTVAWSIIVVFSRVGVILAVTLGMSVLFSLIMLSAAVLVFGPSTAIDFKYGRLTVFYASAFIVLLGIFSIVMADEFPRLYETFVDL